MKLNERCRQRREELGLSQTQVAEAVSRLVKRSFTQQAYGKYENGKSTDTKFILAILKVLDLNDEVAITADDPLSIPSIKATCEVMSRLSEEDRQLLEEMAKNLEKRQKRK